MIKGDKKDFEGFCGKPMIYVWQIELKFFEGGGLYTNTIASNSYTRYNTNYIN
jgi:hypothetical protein